MAVLAEIQASATLTDGGRAQEAVLRASLSSPGAGLGRLPVLDGSVAAFSPLPGDQGLGGPSQVLAPFVVQVDGALVPVSQQQGSIEVTERIDGTTQFSFSMPRRKDGWFVEPLGTPASFLGPPPGKAAIDLTAVYLTGSGAVVVPLVRNGVVDNAPGAVSPAGDLRTIHGLGPHGRYDAKLVDLVFPPGHGLTLAEMVGRILEEMGVEDAFGAGGLDDTPRYNEVVATNVPGLPLIQDLLAIEGKRLFWDREGRPEIRSVIYVAGTEPDWQLGEHELLADAGFSDQPVSSGPTRVSVTGNKQLVLDGDGSGLTTTIQVTEVEAVYAPVACEFEVVDSSGTLSPTGYTSTEKLQLVQRVRVTRELAGRTLVSETTEVEEFYNREDKAGNLDSFGAIVWDSVSAWAETAEGPRRVSSRERFERTSRQTAIRTFDEDGYLFQVVEERWGWYNPRSSLGAIDASGDLTFRAGQFVVWNGDGVDHASEQWERLERVTTIFTVEDGYVLGERIEVEAFRARAGGSWWYNGGFRSKDFSETFQTIERRTVSYSAVGEASVTKTTIVLDESGKTVEVVTEELDGYLPAAERREETVPDPDEFPNGQAASRDETQLIEAEFVSEELEAYREPREETLSNPYIESVEEGLFLAEQRVREGSAIPVAFATAFNTLIRAGQVARVHLPSRGVGPHDVFVTEVRHRLERTESGARGVTTISGEVYVV